MRYLPLILALGACGEHDSGFVVVDAGKFDEVEVLRVAHQTLLLAQGRVANAVGTLSREWRITLSDDPQDCGFLRGCTSEFGDITVIVHSLDTTVGCTSLPHEVLHAMVYSLDMVVAGDHAEPGLWRETNGARSLETFIYSRLCPTN